MNENFIRQTLACVSPLDTYVSNQPCVWFYRANFSKSIELKTRKKRRNKTIKFQCKETISLCKPFKQPKTYYFHDTNKAKTELNGSLTHSHTYTHTQGKRVWTSEWGFEKATLSMPCTALNIEFNAYVMCIHLISVLVNRSLHILKIKSLILWFDILIWKSFKLTSQLTAVVPRIHLLYKCVSGVFVCFSTWYGCLSTQHTEESVFKQANKSFRNICVRMII